MRVVLLNGWFRRAPCKGGAFQWVQAPPGDSLQPEAIGAVMEVTKWLKPLISITAGFQTDCTFPSVIRSFIPRYFNLTGSPLSLSIYQFIRHLQSFGSGRHWRRSLMARRRPRVNQESLPRASLAGWRSGRFFRQELDCWLGPTCRSRPPNIGREP